MKKKRKLGRKLLSFMLTLAMVIGLMPGMGLTAYATTDTVAGGVSYIDENGENKVVSEYTEVTSSITNWSSGWYVVNGEVTISQSIKFTGNVHLLLCDGAKLTVTVPGGRNSGAMVSSNQNDSLTIYGQENGTGELNLTNQNGRGIYYQASGDQTTINGGNITISSTATGIQCKKIIINAGNVTGNGNCMITLSATNVEINGGKITAVGSRQAIAGSVKNVITGKGWTNQEGTEGEADIPISAEGQSLESYKKVYFEGKTASTVTQFPKAKELIYNGTAQELVTAGTATGGTMQYAFGTDATTEPTEGWGTIPTATDAGTYYVWYKAVGDSDHLDSEAGCVAVKINEAEKEEVISDIEISEDMGSVKDITEEVSGETDSFKTKIENSSELKTVLGLSEDEVTEGVNVWLDVKNVGEAVPGEDKELVENAAGDSTVGMYLDINLFKKVGNNETQKVTQTSGPIKASILIPESLRKSGRTFEIVRVHDGKATVLPGKYDESTGIFTFETDMFSTYAIVYKDASESTDDTSEEPSENTDASSDESSENTDITSDESSDSTDVSSEELSENTDASSDETSENTDVNSDETTDSTGEAATENENSEAAETAETVVYKVPEYPLYRLYNTRTGEHFFTMSEEERNYWLERSAETGWTDEKIAWYVRKDTGIPVYRVFDANRTGQHRFTSDVNERDEYLNKGWVDEGIGWYSSGSDGKKVYKLKHPTAKKHCYHYTIYEEERDTLLAQGWTLEESGFTGQ